MPTFCKQPSKRGQEGRVKIFPTNFFIHVDSKRNERSKRSKRSNTVIVATDVKGDTSWRVRYGTV